MLQSKFFEVQNIIGVNMAQQVKVLLGFSFGLLDKIIPYVKDERSNLTSLITTLILVVSCSLLKLATPFIGSCFEHAMFKATLYATKNSKYVVVSLRLV